MKAAGTPADRRWQRVAMDDRHTPSCTTRPTGDYHTGLHGFIHSLQEFIPYQGSRAPLLFLAVEQL